MFKVGNGVEADYLLLEITIKGLGITKEAKKIKKHKSEQNGIKKQSKNIKTIEKKVFRNYANAQMTNYVKI